MTESPLKPIYLLADSQLLFRRGSNDSLLLRSAVEATGVERPRAAYIGASNGDSLEFYHGIFEPAMEQVEIGECRMILKRPSAQDAKFLEKANLILLAGGSVELGWRAFLENGLRELIPRLFVEGAVLIGVSAGAVQLGRGGLTDDERELLPTFGVLPFYVAAHDERNDWASLRKALSLAGAGSRGFGVPLGGGAIYHGGEIEPVATPLFELLNESNRTSESLAFPAAS
ncbi:MAG: Type 1 glutamine amidotransferase-like domain-containing protein [Acidobacteriaceae bacterium]|nr:Type 1 glutamine amidotransferase-like domain-containing protein [Acidobacteriaceae bacterium]